MTQTQRAIEILYRCEKSALAMLEKEFNGQSLQPSVSKMIAQKRERVAAFEHQLNKKSGS